MLDSPKCPRIEERDNSRGRESSIDNGDIPIISFSLDSRLVSDLMLFHDIMQQIGKGS